MATDPDLYTVGITQDFTRATLNLPPDELTPKGATLLFTARQARTLAELLASAADILEAEGTPNGH